MINILPPEVKIARKFGKRNRSLLSGSFMLLLIGIASTLVMFFNAGLVTRDKNSLQAEIATKQNQAAELIKTRGELEKLDSDLATIEKLYDGEIIFSVLMPQIGGLLPAGTVLNGLTLSGGVDDPLNLEIDMESQALAAVFQQNLVNSDIFEAADITNITSKGEGGADDKYLFSATVTAKFKGSKKPTTANTAVTPAEQPATPGGGAE